MRTAQGTKMLAFAYFRLSSEEAQAGESSSIANQRILVEDYCKRHGITLAREFVDDGYSGATFDRPGFREMMSQLETGKASIVLTKDLSRLGRDMVEASYYAETYFPEHEIRYIATHDNFDSTADNVMAPFQFAMNEVYLRDGSRKVRNVLYSKRERGEYCACPPYGYRKNPDNKAALLPDENTAPVVARIFESAASGDSSRAIAMTLTRDGIIPPLKYRAYHRDAFSDSAAARASDNWNYTTVKRILGNEVYLGHTVLGKSKKVSVKSQKKLSIAKDKWCVTRDTHPPLVTQAVFDLAQRNLGKGTRDYRQYEHVRKSIFAGIAVCELCGYSLCSAGTVYKGEREKYWYLQCTHQRRDIPNPCPGTRIRYADLLELVRSELNQLIALPKAEKQRLAREASKATGGSEHADALKAQADKAGARIATIDKIITKLYHDNIAGKLDDDRLAKMVDELERETRTLQQVIADAQPGANKALEVEENYRQFFELVSYYTDVAEVDREILQTFIDKIVIGPKAPTQSITIHYRFIGPLAH